MMKQINRDKLDKFAVALGDFLDVNIEYIEPEEREARKRRKTETKTYHVTVEQIEP
jgi:hypothetical protein